MTTTRRRDISEGWLFGGEIPLAGPEDALIAEVIGAYADPALDDDGWQAVTVPHVVTELSWRSWNPMTWEKVWAYRRHLDFDDVRPGERVFIEFDGVMTNATVFLNGVALGEHKGGYLPFRFEITDIARRERSAVLAVAVDSRFNVNVPPNLPAPALSTSIDYLQPGGIHRAVRVLNTPATFIAELALTHHDVLDPQRRSTDVIVTVDGGAARSSVEVRVMDAAGQQIASASGKVSDGVAHLSISGLERIELWDLDSPHLYQVTAELRVDDEIVHSASRRTGYREARFELDGFFLNGTRRYLSGVNRHGYFPYAGFAMPDRVHRRDAEIIKNELNCAMVRCSHYPQSDSFLDACDEIGLLVWEESPGWQYVGDAAWQDAAADDIEAMIARDRHRPSIIVWGARLNETPDRPEFYARTEALVKRLDPSRATSGTMFGDYARHQTFQHDVFSYDDYTTELQADGTRTPVLLEPVADRPYLVSEAISTRSSPTTFYLRADGAQNQQHQALDYAIAHDHARGDERFAGLLAWVGFDYQANMGNHHRGIKTSGLGDVFRVLKPGAAIYRSQVDPDIRAVIEPAFTWDPPEFGQANSFGGRPEGRLWGPGQRAMICSNLDHLVVRLGDRVVADAYPDRNRFANLPYAPTFVDLRLLDRDVPDLIIEGYRGNDLVATHRMDGDRSSDSLRLRADDQSIIGDGVDATRVEIAVTDKHGVARGRTQAIVEVAIQGDAVLVGGPRIDLSETGAVAAVWVRSAVGATGTAIVTVTAPGYGAETTVIHLIDSTSVKKENPSC